MDKQYILKEIKRMAEENGGVPLGQTRFSNETGIRVSDWKGRFWVRWSDALKEAGLTPNRFGSNALDRTILVERFITLARELGRFPSVWDVQKAHHDSGFPTRTTFRRALGTQSQIAAKVREFCKGRDGYEDILTLCASIENGSPAPQSEGRAEPEETFGFVYLNKSGRYYKIGSTNDTGRRQYELGIQLPEKVTRIHEIRARRESRHIGTDVLPRSARAANGSS